jgi:hypothetical protein
MMKERWQGFILVASLMSLFPAVSAQPLGFEESITIQDLFIYFIIVLVLLVVAYVILQRIYKRGIRIRKKSPLISAFGSLFGFLSIGIGSFLIILSVLILISDYTGITQFMTANNLVTTFFPDVFVGLIVMLVGGAVLFVLGFIIIVLIHVDPIIDKHGMPIGSGTNPKGRDAPEIPEPLNPTLKFRVIHRSTDLPAADAKVILKERKGNSFHTKFTDFNGEVKFSNVDGYAPDYYAYVEGDEMREEYRVILI